MALNVLIVDDSEVMRKVIRRVVNLSGFELGEFFEAENGESAMSKLDENWIDLILTDINMPVMDGVEMLEKIKANEALSDIPVIFVSTEGRSEHIEEILSKGAAGFITKPFKPEDIRCLISETIGVEANGSYSEEFEDSDF